MRIGVVKTSLKDHDRRIPIYPEHLSWIAPEIRKHLVFENGYGGDYGYADSYFTDQGAMVASREKLFETCNLLMLPKPVASDLEQMRLNQILWGWVHCVQQRSMAQWAIDRSLTYIAWEAMHQWSRAGERLMHVFYKNNELAGYASVLHLLQLMGLDGHYGRRRMVVITGYGSVSRGAIHALQGRGFNQIHVYTQRPTHLVNNQNPDVYYHRYERDDSGRVWACEQDGSTRPLIEVLAEADIICNGILQDTDDPVMFVQADEIGLLKPRSMIIDVSCDKGMGFPFATPTSFDQPTFVVGDRITYYSVDHTPTYLWNAATREISRAVIQYLATIIAGPSAWDADETVRRAIEIKDGRIMNEKILSFQRRAREYPHDSL